MGGYWYAVTHELLVRVIAKSIESQRIKFGLASGRLA